MWTEEASTEQAVLPEELLGTKQEKSCELGRLGRTAQLGGQRVRPGEAVCY